MSRLLYYFILIPISLLPYPLLYLLSDLTCFFVYRVFRYRREVVRENLTNAFPEKELKEIIKIEKKFYSHFCDLIVESIKNFTITNKQATRRMHAINPEMCEKYLEQNRSIIFCGGHFNNWELWAVAFPITNKYRMAGIYKKINDKFLNRVMIKTRGKFGLTLVETKEVSNDFFTRNRPIATVFAFDQSPHKANKAYWVDFLGRRTASYFGPEKYAKTHDMPVIFGHIRKVKRGYYETWYEPLFEEPTEEEYGAITEKLNQVLEQDILEAPEYWLWTHKRWKHTKD